MKNLRILLPLLLAIIVIGGLGLLAYFLFAGRDAGISASDDVEEAEAINTFVIAKDTVKVYQSPSLKGTEAMIVPKGDTLQVLTQYADKGVTEILYNQSTEENTTKQLRGFIATKDITIISDNTEPVSAETLLSDTCHHSAECLTIVDSIALDSLWQQMLVDLFSNHEDTLKRLRDDSLLTDIKKNHLDSLALAQLVAKYQVKTNPSTKASNWLIWTVAFVALILGFLFAFVGPVALRFFKRIIQRRSSSDNISLELRETDAVEKSFLKDLIIIKK